MNEEFAKAYSQLNTRQKQAVDTIDGPVLVVAGPGTGKTQLLSVRVANILQKTDTDPSSILCLTFTNFAATNMRQRLTQLIGSSAHTVVVRTFHSFASEIMNLYPDYFWQGARLDIAPDAVQLDIIQDIVAQLPLDNPLAQRFAGNYTALHDIQQAMKLSKEAGLTPEKLQAMLAINETYLDEIEPALVAILDAPLSAKKLASLQAKIDALPDQAIDQTVAPLTSLSTVIKESLASALEADSESGKTTHTGKWKRQWLQNVNGTKGMFDERRRLAWWQALAGVYAQYRDVLHERGYYDYSDMIVEVITQLEQVPELLASVQERFLYVLIDEFQDTNAAQLRFAHLAASHPADEGKPNLLAVGDDDQSIFAFNGAELSNMLAFRRTYPSTHTIVLTDNYRSSQTVLDTAQHIIEQADDRLVKRDATLTKQLVAQTQPAKGEIANVSFPTRQHQFDSMAKRVQELWQSQPDQGLAVLARNHQSLRDMSAALQQLQIPIRYEQQNDVLELPLIEQLYMLAEAITAIADGDSERLNYFLAKFLQHPAWRISPAVLWQLAKANRRNADWLESLLNHDNPDLVAIGNWLLRLSQQAAQEPLPVMLDYLLGLRAGSTLTSPLRDYFLAQQAVDNQYLAGLSGLHRLRGALYEFSALAAHQTMLEDFVRFVRLHKQLDRSLTDESWFMSGERAVELLTVHKAKGLEFDNVILLDAIEDNWRPRRTGRKPPANLPLQPYGEQYDDYVRLLYVAATRAKHTFIVSSYAQDESGKQLLVTPLLQHIPLTEGSVDEDSVRVLEHTIRWPRLQTTQEKHLLQPLLEKYQLSATGLQQFLDITTGGPQRFLERQLLRVPELTTAHMGFGTAIHRAMQTACQLTNQDAFDLDGVLTSYEQSLLSQQLSKSDTQRYLTHGKAILKNLFAEKNFTFQPGGQAEISLSYESPQLGRLIGALDYVYVDKDTLCITDYKTGKPLQSFATRDKTKAVKAWRHRQQLLFYALLARKSGRFASSSTITNIVYVEAETVDELSRELQPSDEELARLEQLISIVWQRIQSLDLPDITAYSVDAEGIAKFEADLLSGTI